MNYYYLGTALCYKSVIEHSKSCRTLVLHVLAVDLCRNENGIPFLNHKTDYKETNETIASIYRELKRQVKNVLEVVRSR